MPLSWRCRHRRPAAATRDSAAPGPLVQARNGTGGIGGPHVDRRRHQPVETVAVHRLGRRVEPVATAIGDQHGRTALAEQPAGPRDMGLHGPGDVLGQPRLTPQPIGQHVDRDDPTVAEQQRRHQPPLEHAGQHDRRPHRVDNLERPEDVVAQGARRRSHRG